MPAVFLGHGSPMNALGANRYTAAWREFGASIPRPAAVLAVSAHWTTRGIGVTAMDHPPTIHDFGGFPKELFAVQYPAPGSPQLAARVRELLAPLEVGLDRSSWGLDHGTWSVLLHVFPQHDVPVVQLSLDMTQPAEFHYELGARLSPLRDEGVLIVGSGNVVHNLRTARWGANAAAYDWAAGFNATFRQQLEKRDHAPLIAYDQLGEPARLSINSAEHYLPALYIAGLQSDQDALSFLTDGIELASISMLSFAIDSRNKRMA